MVTQHAVCIMQTREAQWAPNAEAWLLGVRS